MDEELTLRDLYLVLARYRAVLIALPLLAALLTFAVVSLLPRPYSSQVLVAVNVVTDLPTDAGVFGVDPKLFPSPQALSNAYQQSAPARLAGVWRADAADIARDLDARQDDKSGALSLTAHAQSPTAARERAAQAAADFSRYVDGVVSGVLRSGLAATERRLQAQIQADSDLIGQLTALRKGVPLTLPGNGQASVREQLTQAGVDPRLAGNGYGAANPAYTLLTINIAQAQTRVASAEADLARLKAVLADPAQQLALSRQLVQASTLGDPALPLKPDGLGPLTLAVLAYLLTLVACVLGALLHHAVRGPETRPLASRAVITGD